METYTNGNKTISLIEKRNILNNQAGYQSYINGVKNAWICFDFAGSFLKHNLGSFWKESDLVPNPK